MSLSKLLQNDFFIQSHWEYLAYKSDSSRATFSEHDCCILVNQLNSMFELNQHFPCVTCSETLVVTQHLYNLYCVPYASDVGDCLVADFDSRMVVRYLYTCREVFRAHCMEWVYIFLKLSNRVYQTRTFSYLVFSDHLFAKDFDLQSN